MRNTLNIVIGGAGFIGTHLIDKLKREGEFTVSIDREEYNFKKYPTDFMTNLLTTNRYFLRNCFNTVVQDNQNIIIDYIKIWHCASVVGVAAFSNEEDNNLLNQGVALNTIVKDAIIELKNHLIKNFGDTSPKISLVFLSTSELYGNGNDGIITEKSQIVLDTFKGIRNYYVLQKYFAELQYKSLSEVEDIPVKIFRLFNVIGVGQRKEAGVIPKIISQLLSERTERIELKKDDTYGRCYLPVDFAVSQMYYLSIYSENNIENIFSKFYFSDNQLIEEIKSHFTLENCNDTYYAVDVKDSIKAGTVGDVYKNIDSVYKIFQIQTDESTEIKFRYFDDKNSGITKEEVIEKSKNNFYREHITRIIKDIIEDQNHDNRKI